MTKPLRGEVWRTQFFPSVGQEITKERPAIVMNEAGFGRLELSIVVPITDWKPAYQNYSWFIPLQPSARNGLAKASGADAFQIKSLANVRLISKLGRLDDSEIEDIAATVAACIGAQL